MRDDRWPARRDLFPISSDASEASSEIPESDQRPKNMTGEPTLHSFLRRKQHRAHLLYLVYLPAKSAYLQPVLGGRQIIGMGSVDEG